ncbi:MAG: methionyl-tRNA formyltransferase, partial [Synergistaceae bacterium]|nr:methionyl-tRNA formyltransferase [Synergistaceae bacterium]
DLLSEVDSNPPEIIFVIDFGQMIKPPVLDCMCLNIHPSLLPEYRGAAPIQRALLDGKDKTGVTVFQLVKAMDAGDILAQREITVKPEHNASDLYNILSDLGSELAAESLKAPLIFRPQDNSLATFADKLMKEEFALSFSMTAQKIFNSVRALDMSGGAYVTMHNGKRLKLWRVKLRSDLHDEESGKILEIANCPVISCGDFAVELLEVQAEGKNKTSGLEWSRGMRLKEGEIL